MNRNVLCAARFSLNSWQGTKFDFERVFFHQLMNQEKAKIMTLQVSEPKTIFCLSFTLLDRAVLLPQRCKTFNRLQLFRKNLYLLIRFLSRRIKVLLIYIKITIKTYFDLDVFVLNIWNRVEDFELEFKRSFVHIELFATFEQFPFLQLRKLQIAF